MAEGAVGTHLGWYLKTFWSIHDTLTKAFTTLEVLRILKAP
jgi:hypothetical protein